MRLKRNYVFGLLVAVFALASTFAAHATFAADSAHGVAAVIPNLPHKLDDMGVSVEPPGKTSNLTRLEAVRAATKLLPASIQNPNAAVVATNFVKYRDSGEFANGIHAWVVSFQVNVPKVAGVPGDGVHPSVTNYGHADSMDVIVDDATGVALQNFVHGAWDKTVSCFSDGHCETTYH
jgi:hypothetical protein